VLRFIAARLAGLVIVMFLVATIVFVISRVIPGDPAAVMLGAAATAEDAARLRSQLGLDAPLPTQYLTWIGQLLRLDLGDSIFLGQSVTSAMLERSELTLNLAAMGLGLVVLFGIPAGIIVAVWRGTAIDRILNGTALLAASLPSFWIGLILIRYLAAKFGWFPVSGYGPPDASWSEKLYHLVLPAIALALPNAVLLLRTTRTSMLDVLSADYVRTARAKGLSPWSVVARHALRNALVPILTVVGLATAFMIGSTTVTETVFGLPGVGQLVVAAVLRRDYPVIQGALVVISGIYVLLNFLVDMLYLLVDPRVRAGAK
jgi:peptide/nickel transport system permease protein